MRAEASATAELFTVSRTFAPISFVDSTVSPCGLPRARSGVRKPCSSTLRTARFDRRGLGFKAGASGAESARR